MRIVATFESTSFKFPLEDISEPGEPPGKDVALWLAARVGKLNSVLVEEPEPEDFGWYITFSTEGVRYQAVIGPVGDEFWYVVVERVVGILPSIFGFRRRHKTPEGLLLVHKALKEAEETSRLQWHSWKSFSGGGVSAFDNGMDMPVAF